jgi:hypothetical protein
MVRALSGHVMVLYFFLMAYSYLGVRLAGRPGDPREPGR